MRSLAVLWLCVLSTADSPAAVPVSTDSPSPNWMEVHEKAVAAIKNRQFETAAELFRASQPLARNEVQRGLSANDLGVTLHQLIRDSEAKVQLETAFAIWQASPHEQARMSQTAEALAAVNRTLGDYAGAEKVLRTALATPAADIENHALLTNELGDILREVGRSAEAHRLFEKTLAQPGISPRRQVDALVGMADLDRDAHSWDASFEGWNKALTIVREQHWVSLEAAAVRGLGMTYLDRGELARAEPLLRRALALFESQPVPGHQIASTLSCLAQLYHAEKKFSLAEEVLQRAIRIAEQTLGAEHPQVAVLLEMLGDAEASQKHLTRATEHFERARAIMANRFGAKSPMAAAVSASLALAEQRADHNAEAAAHFEQALAVLNTAGPEAQSMRDAVMKGYLDTCKALHRKVTPAVSSFSR